MVKIRTVIPANAKPGSSVIQVVHPKTGRPSRVRVPIDAKAGQVIELELADDTDIPSSTRNAIISPAQLRPTTQPAIKITNLPKSPLVNLDAEPSKGSIPKNVLVDAVGKPSTHSADTSNQGTIAQIPPPTQLPMPPFGRVSPNVLVLENEKKPLLSSEEEQDCEDEKTHSNCCTSCLMNPVQFFKTLFLD